ncbi:MAG: lipopolysaccharide heptosyltransferase II [Candidatus Abyssubacteria bacterium]|nr:lipopolysaccharide heptosyltransferase II [Candidatus Abyssubacteria bacterium]
MRLPNWVGDVVMATPALRCLRRNFPNAHIDLSLIPYVRKIVEGAPWFDGIVEYSPDREHKGLAGHLRHLRLLRRNRYDLAVVLPNSFSSALLAFLSGAKRRIGYDRQGRGFLLTDRVPTPTENGKLVPQPMVDYYLKLCEELGAAPDSRKTQLFVDEESERRADELFRRHGIGQGKPVVAINPGAAYGSSKLWDTRRFAQVADSLLRREGCDVAVLGGPGEKETAREIIAATRSNLANLAEENVPLDILKSVIKRCDLLITVDSGPRHFAVAFDKPVVVLMGPTDPRYTNYNLEKTIVLRIDDLDCAPCHIKECPTDHECMTRITPDMVFRAATELLQKHAKQ